MIEKISVLKKSVSRKADVRREIIDVFCKTGPAAGST